LKAAQQPTNVHLGEEDEVDGVRMSLARLTLVLAKKPQPGLSSRVADLKMNSYHTKLLHLQITL
jgi:hypothetical protein